MKVRTGIILLAVVLAIAARAVLIATPFAYTPDIYYYDTQAVQALASGQNPYGHDYVVPPWLATAGAENVFAYLPMVLLFLFPFGLAGDVRVGLVACDALVAIGLYLLRGKWADVVAAAFLLLPFTVLFSTWYPNNTLVGMAMLGMGIALRMLDRQWTSAIFVGLSLGASQLVWLFYPFVLSQSLRERKFAQVLVTLATAAAVVLPFVLVNPSAFFSNTILFEFERPVQGLVTAQAFGINVNPTLGGLATTLLGVALPFVLKAALATAGLAFLLFRTRSPESATLNGSYFLLFAIFILPNNFSWWYLELPFQTLLTWFLISKGSIANKP